MPADGSSRSRSRRRSVWQKALAVVLALVATLGGLEVAVRVYSALVRPRMMTLDPVLGWRHEAGRQRRMENEDGEVNLVVQNEFGQRGPSHGRRRNAGKFRVLVLGDSFVEAVQVGEKEVFTRVLEAADPELEVLNAGTGGWGTVQEYLYLRREGLRFAPDLVLVVVYENDLVDNCTAYSPGLGPRPYAVREGRRVRIVAAADGAYLRFVAPLPLRGFLVTNSYLFYAFNQVVWQRLRAAELRRVEANDRRALDREGTREIFLGLVTEIHALLQQRAVRLALVPIPSREDLGRAPGAWLDRVRSFCDGKGIAFLPLLEAFSAAARDGRRCYFDRDIHWTKEGHQVAAAALLPWIEQEKAAGRTATSSRRPAERGDRQVLEAADENAGGVARRVVGEKGE